MTQYSDALMEKVASINTNGELIVVQTPNYWAKITSGRLLEALGDRIAFSMPGKNTIVLGARSEADANSIAGELHVARDAYIAARKAQPLTLGEAR